MVKQEQRDAPTLRQATATGHGALMGAIFLMATSAIGPGVLTQTAVFTNPLGAAFAIAVQLNVWRVIGTSGMRAQELGNTVLPGLGWGWRSWSASVASSSTSVTSPSRSSCSNG